MDQEMKAHIGYLLEAIQDLKHWTERVAVALEAGTGATKQRAEIEALITEREMMLAGNHERRTHGYADMYGPDHFYELAERMRAAGKEG